MLVLTLFGAIACKSAKKNPNTNVVEEVKPEKVAEEAAKAPVVVTFEDPKQQAVHEAVTEEAVVIEKEKNVAYAFTVSFFSIGEGTDAKMMNRFKEFIENYNKEKNVSLVYDLNAWGREGEADFCFMLSELDQSQRADFIEKGTKLLSESKLVHLGENTQCHPKRR